MKKRLLSFMACPVCVGPLSMEVWHGDTEIDEGLISCACGMNFPIIRGVPRMLVGTLREQLWQDYAEFFQRNRSRLPADSVPSSAATTSAERATQSSFGFEWTKYSAMRPEWETNFWEYQAPCKPEFFEGKLVLDAGCGMGRHLYYSSQHSRDAIGVDFSRAVDSAYANTHHLPHAHVVQADLTQLPFAPQTFDYLYSIGVLHHVPNPPAALRGLLDLVAPGGDVRVYVYWDLSGEPRWKRVLLRGVTLARRITTRLPHWLLHLLCWPIALGAYATFVLPYKLLSLVRPTRRFAETLPLKQYAAYPFGVLLNDQFDRFSAPLEKRYSSSEVREWLESAGLADVRVAPCWGWLGYGRWQPTTERPPHRSITSGDASVTLASESVK